MRTFWIVIGFPARLLLVLFWAWVYSCLAMFGNQDGAREPRVMWRFLVYSEQIPDEDVLTSWM